MNSKERRIEEKLRLLSEGKKADEIDAIFEARKRRHDRQKEHRGNPSEDNVYVELKKRPYVREVQRLRGVQSQEREKRDLQILIEPTSFKHHFNTALSIPNGKLWVQVKSSDGGIDQYKADIIAKFDINPADVSLWMNENRQIALDGSRTASIISMFEAQLRAMNDYWVHRPK